jgi:hypothetical protein
MHPYALALSDRTIYPEKGIRLRFTLRGKICMLCLVFLNACLLLICQGMIIFHVKVHGMLGLIKGESNGGTNAGMSLLSMVSTLYDSVKWSDSNSLEISLLFFVTTCFVPFLRLFGLAILWSLPLTLEQERRVFRWLEILSAWSSLDVFLLSLVIMSLQMKSSTEQLIADFIPEMSKLMKRLLPYELGDIYADIQLSTPGFAVLIFAIVLDKFVAHIIIEQAVASISERIADETLNEAVVVAAVANSQPTTPSMFYSTGVSPGYIHNISEGDEDEDEDGVTYQDDLEFGDLQMPTPSMTRQESAPSEDEIIDAAESILETSAVAYFGPVERYLSALMPGKMYAGFPRRAWSSVGKRLGLVDDADVVICYNEFGIKPDALSSPPIEDGFSPDLSQS